MIFYYVIRFHESVIHLLLNLICAKFLLIVYLKSFHNLIWIRVYIWIAQLVNFEWIFFFWINCFPLLLFRRLCYSFLNIQSIFFRIFLKYLIPWMINIFESRRSDFRLFKIKKFISIIVIRFSILLELKRFVLKCIF